VSARRDSRSHALSGTRGSGGNLKVLMWQGATILNPHLAQGTKDNIAARFCTEPLMTVGGDDGREALAVALTIGSEIERTLPSLAAGTHLAAGACHTLCRWRSIRRPSRGMCRQRAAGA